MRSRESARSHGAGSSSENKEAPETHSSSPSFSVSLSHTYLPVRVWVQRSENTVRYAKKTQPGSFLFSSPNLKTYEQNNLK